MRPETRVDVSLQQHSTSWPHMMIRLGACT